MIFYKTEEEINLIKRSGDLLGRAHGEVAKLIRPGIKTAELDNVAYEFIKSHGGVPSFKGYNGFPYSLCISVNENVVHGMPGEYELKEGDIVSIDCGVFLNGFHSDSAYTYAVGEISEEDKKLLSVTKESLEKGIEQAISGNRIGDVGFAVQYFVETAGFSVVRELVGHGVGKKLHESPEVPNYGKRGKGVKLTEGMVLAIEPMVNAGKKNIVQEADGWTIRTADRKHSAHFEHTVAVKKGKAEVLTTFKYIEEVLKK
ncbi:MAG: type I methionyl aminopeptidase [Cytophagaceae bacterium]|nr:type I methionyl aminopeptidase [Cytophagaceae bacterium]